MSINLEKLKKLACGAARGDWQRTKAGHIMTGNDIIAECPPCQGHRGERNAKYIAAANPSVVLALINQAESVERQRDQLREALVYVADFSGCEHSRNTARAALGATKEDSP